MANNSIGLIELGSIAAGYEVSDAMLKAAAVDLVLARSICSGKYMVMVRGDVAGIQSSVDAGVRAGGFSVIDTFVIPNVHESIFPAIAGTTKGTGIRTLVSMDPLMVDGTGMCGGCRVKVGGKVRFACVDGPDFDGHLVDFDDLTARLRRFTEQEHAALDRWTESCRMKAPEEEELELPDPAEEVGGG